MLKASCQNLIGSLKCFLKQLPLIFIAFSMVYKNIICRTIIVISIVISIIGNVAAQVGKESGFPNIDKDSELVTPILDMTTAPDAFLDLTPFIEFWVDSSGNATWEKALNYPAYKLMLSDSFKQNKYFVDQNLWIRFNIKNSNLTDSLKIVIVKSGLLLYHWEIRMFNEGIEVDKKSNYRWSLLKDILIIPPNSKRLICVKSEYRYYGVENFGFDKKNNILHFSICSIKKWESTEQTITKNLAPYQDLTSFIIGAIFIIFFFSIFQYIILREKIYIYYIAYLFILFIYLWGWFNAENNGKEFLIPSPFNYTREFESACFYIGYIFYFLFLSGFSDSLSIKAIKYLKLAKNTIIILFLINIFVYFLFTHYKFYQLYITIRIIIECSNLFTLFYLFQSKNRLSIFLGIGVLSLAVGLTLSQVMALAGLSGVNVWTNNMTYLYLGIFLEILCFSASLSYRFKIIKDEMALNKQKIIQSEIDTLRLQINPHLIFNGLTVAGGAMLDSPINGIRYITAFAKYLRSVLENSRHSLIPLSKEIEMLEQYIFVEQTRKPNIFQFMIEIDSSADAEEIMVPPTILQPYAENTIKHGFDDSIGDFMLSVRCWANHDFLYITLTDNGIGRDVAREKNAGRLTGKKESLGLKITQERIQMSGGAFNPTNEVQIKDLKDDSGKAIGTSVMIKIAIL